MCLKIINSQNEHWDFFFMNLTIKFHEKTSSFFYICIVHRPLDIKNRPRIPIPDEDPYSIAGNGGGSGSSGSSGFGNNNSAPGW